MKKFKFRLQALQRVREMALERAQQKVAECENLLSETKRKLLLLQIEHKQQVELFSVKQNMPLPVDEFRLQREFIVKIDRLMSEQMEIEKQREYQLELAQKELRKAALDLQVIEKLRDKHWLRYWQEGLSEEQKLLDEMGQRVTNGG